MASERYVSIDIECVASGKRHDQRIVALIAVVDEKENVVLKRTVKQTNVYNYLTPLTGLREGDLDDGVPFEDAVRDVTALLGSDVVLVGQAIESDIKWLKLVKGVDYKSFVDLAVMFKTYNPRFDDYSVFSLSHEVKTLLPSRFHIGDKHQPENDALASMMLFNKYHNDKALLNEAKQRLLRSRHTPSWAKRNDYRCEDVCMAAFIPQKCICGAPTLKRIDTSA